MSKRSIPGLKDASGAYIIQGGPQPWRASPPDSSITPQNAPGTIIMEAPRGSLDDILKQQLAGLERLTKHLVSEITAGNITKDTPSQLATVLKLTMELKAKEKEILDDMSDEELEKAT